MKIASLLALLAACTLALTSPAATPVTHRLLLTDYKGDRVALLSASGDIEWEYPAKTPQDCWLLPNGDVLVSQINGAIEVTPAKQVVWQYTAPANARVHACQPLPDGNVLVGENGTSRLVLVGRDGQPVKIIPVDSHPPKYPAHQMRGARRAPNGHYWVCLMDEQKLVELAPDGTLLRAIPLDGQPTESVALPNGHLLVSLWRKTRVVEFDENFQVVWEIGEKELPGYPLLHPVGLQRLPNGNTVIGNFSGKIGGEPDARQAMLIEVTPDKQVVWTFADHARFRTVCQVQVLDTPADATRGEVLR